MKHTIHERGALSTVVVVVVVLLAAVTATAAYTMTKSNRKDAQTSALPSPTSSPSMSASPIATAVPSPAGNVFVVKELGIQLTVSSDMQDLKYVAKTSNGKTAAYFSTASLESADKKAAGKYCTPEADAPLGAVRLDTSSGYGERVIKTIGNQSFFYAGPQSACSQDASVMSLANKQAQAFLQILNTAEAIR